MAKTGLSARTLAVLTILLFGALIGFNGPAASAAPINLSDLVLNGNGLYPGDWYPQLIDSGSTLRLLPNHDINDPAHPTDGLATAGPSPAASAWYKHRLPVVYGFTTTFQFRMSEQTGGADYVGTNEDVDGADGIAFVIQNQGLGALGVGAGGVGYEWINNAVALEFDTWKNAPWYGDPPLICGTSPSCVPYTTNPDHISLHSSKSMVDDFLVPHHRCIAADCVWTGGYPTGRVCTMVGDGTPSNSAPYDGILTSTECTTDWPGWPGWLVTDFWYSTDVPYHCRANPDLGSVTSATMNLNDGQWHTVTINYVPGTLTVYLDGSLMLTVNVDLGQLLDLPCDGTAYVGFTSGERGGYQNHDIKSWTYEGTPQPTTTSSTTVSTTLVQSTSTVYSTLSTVSTVETSTSTSFTTSTTCPVTVTYSLRTVTEHVTQVDTVYAYLLVILQELQKAVGGFVESVNKLMILSPWLAVIAVSGCIGIGALVIRKRRS